MPLNQAGWNPAPILDIVKYRTAEVSMTDLHEAGDPRYTAQIDSIGWVFAAVVLVIAAIAGMVAYHGSEASAVNMPTAQVAASR